MGPCEVGLFASCLTKQPPWIYSWRLDPEAERVDTFKQYWSQIWALPALFGAKYLLSGSSKRQKARAVLITPLWNTPSIVPNSTKTLEIFLPATTAGRSSDVPTA